MPDTVLSPEAPGVDEDRSCSRRELHRKEPVSSIPEGGKAPQIRMVRSVGRPQRVLQVEAADTGRGGEHLVPECLEESRQDEMQCRGERESGGGG